jgi:hypothetical protein
MKNFLKHAVVRRLALGSSFFTLAGMAQAGELPAADDVHDLELVSGDDGLAAVDGVEESGDELSLAGRYVPVPAHSYRPYRIYRPSYQFRVVPPPVFVPGWWGLYLWGNPPPPPVAREPEPPREAPRRPDFSHEKEYSLSVTGGAYAGSYRATGGDVYQDPGVRVALKYRNTPVVGAELSVGMFGSGMRLDGMGSTARQDVPVQFSATLNAFPNSPIQPYAVLGATANFRTYSYVDSTGAFGDPYTEVRVGPHVGLGLEMMVGERVSASIDGRRIFYTMVDREVIDQTGQDDLAVTGGLNFYF